MPAGEFILGYPDSDGNVSGQPVQKPQPQPPPYDPTPTPPLAQPLPAWARNGSFVVYRRLRQDVAAFRQAMTDQAGPAGITPEQLGAKITGRWPSGAPLARVPGEPKHLDPTASDPSITYFAVLEDQRINNFDYRQDPDGTAVPRAAHIRKSNPRADQLPDGDKSSRHRMLRRGITYGSEFQQGETPYGETVPSQQDRGLLFARSAPALEPSPRG